jgi:Ankyrin repeats (many copies)
MGTYIGIFLLCRLLHQAALWDNAELLEDLLNGEELAFINSCDSWGRTPLHAASTTESSQCLRFSYCYIAKSPQSTGTGTQEACGTGTGNDQDNIYTKNSCA